MLGLKVLDVCRRFVGVSGEGRRILDSGSGTKQVSVSSDHAPRSSGIKPSQPESQILWF